MTSYTLTYTATTGQRSISGVDAAIQTTSDSSASVGVQTEQSEDILPTCSSAKPPRPQSGTAHKSLPLRRRRMKKDPVFGRRYLKNFKATPIEFVELHVCDLIASVNPLQADVKCCFYHVSLHFLQHVLLHMMTQHCKADMLPYMDWQCPQCLTLYGDDDDEERAHIDSCAVCGTERALICHTSSPRESPLDPTESSMDSDSVDN